MLEGKDAYLRERGEDVQESCGEKDGGHDAEELHGTLVAPPNSRLMRGKKAKKELIRYRLLFGTIKKYFAPVWQRPCRFRSRRGLRYSPPGEEGTG